MDDLPLLSGIGRSSVSFPHPAQKQMEGSDRPRLARTQQLLPGLLPQLDRSCIGPAPCVLTKIDKPDPASCRIELIELPDATVRLAFVSARHPLRIDVHGMNASSSVLYR
jgi:hypothetical protein